LKKNGK